MLIRHWDSPRNFEYLGMSLKDTLTPTGKSKTGICLISPKSPCLRTLKFKWIVFPERLVITYMKSWKKVKPVREVREVILSEGLNNCLKRLLPTTTDKQLGFLVAASKRTFPNAKFHVPVINYLDKLDKDQLQL